MATIKKACKGTSYPRSSSVSKRLGSPSRKMKTGGSFPDLNKDGKITKKDVLIGRGVLPKTAKKGKMVKKAQDGKALAYVNRTKGNFVGPLSSGEDDNRRMNYMTEQSDQRRRTKAINAAPIRKGASRTPMLGVRNQIWNAADDADVSYPRPTKSYFKKGGSMKKSSSKKTMKTGGKMKKCAYGCK